MFCHYTLSSYFKFSLKLIRSNPGYLLKYFLLYKNTKKYQLTMPLSKRIVVQTIVRYDDGPTKKGTTQQERGSYIVQPSLLFDLESQLPDDRSPHRTSRQTTTPLHCPLAIHFKKVSHYYNLLDQIRLLRILWLWNFQFEIVSKFFITLSYSIRSTLIFDHYNVRSY